MTAKRVVIARSKDGNRELEGLLAGTHISLTKVETVRFSPPKDWTDVDAALKRLHSFDWVVVTSPRAADAFAGRLKTLRIRKGEGFPNLAAVGPSTAARLEGAGLTVSFVPREYLTAALGSEMPTSSGSRCLLLRSNIADRGLTDALKERGFETTDLAVYSTDRVKRIVSVGDVEGADLVVFASPSEVRGFVGRVPNAALSRLRAEGVAVCIGPVTAGAAKKAGFKTVKAPKEHTLKALAGMIRRTVNAS